jgi:hypothetical protein
LLAGLFFGQIYWSIEQAWPGSLTGPDPVSDSTAVYYSFVTLATLGYGDVTPVKEWLLLGPMTAMNGVLLYGWSTAVIYDVLRRAMAVERGEA